MIVKILRPAGLVHGNVAWEVLMSDGTTKLMSTPDIVSLTPRR